MLLRHATIFKTIAIYLIAYRDVKQSYLKKEILNNLQIYYFNTQFAAWTT